MFKPNSTCKISHTEQDEQQHQVKDGRPVIINLFNGT